MKTIYLLRHAKSSWGDAALADSDRPLNDRGKGAADAMAAFLAEAKIQPNLVLCSSAKRTRETLARILPGLGNKVPAVIEEALYHAEAGDLLRRLHGVDNSLASVMLIGHNPGLEDLARRLASGGDADALARLAAKYPTGALAVLEADVTRWRDLEKDGARLRAFVCPQDFA